MGEYKIRYAAYEDIPEIQTFINENWKKNHILARDKILFEWQYTSNKLDYVLGLDEVGKIQGILGYISYDNNVQRDIALAMWKANSGCSFLGIKLLMFIMKHESYRVLFCSGINMATTKEIYERMGFTIGRMNQWYRLAKRKQYVIAKIENPYIPEYSTCDEADLAEYKTMDELETDFKFDTYVDSNMVPYKSLTYLKRRYFEHPRYEYKVYGVKQAETKAVIVIRVQECNGSRAIRFVDCIGNIGQIANITRAIDKLLEIKNAEYIDMYEAGVSGNMLRKAGWINLEETKNIVPNYFSPFEQSNVTVNYCTTDENIVLFRGDGDQDRPN